MMEDFERYKRLHADWMSDRVMHYGAMPAEDEAEWAEQLDAVWRRLTKAEQEKIEEWIHRQNDWRKANGIPTSGPDFQVSPEERSQFMFQGEYELILAEGESEVVFQIAGRDVTIGRGTLLDYDEEGRYWIARDDAEAMGLLQ